MMDSGSSLGLGRNFLPRSAEKETLSFYILGCSLGDCFCCFWRECVFNNSARCNLYLNPQAQFGSIQTSTPLTNTYLSHVIVSRAA